MDIKDKELIDRFIKQITQEIPSIDAIVLFGSMAREDYDKRSDIDIMLVLNEKHPNKYGQIIAQIITELRPHREIRTVLTNLRDYDEEYYQNVFRDGKILFGKIILTPENLALKSHLLISYDLKGKPNTLQVKVSKKVHGYTSKKYINGQEKVYTYSGLKDSDGAKLVSKSAVILPFDKGQKFIDELKQLDIPIKVFKIWM